MPHYKPAALLVVLDMIEAGEVPQGIIDFDRFEPRFKRLLRPFDGRGAANGWEPFLHLGIGDRMWALTKQGTRLREEELGRITSRAQSRGRIDGAVIGAGDLLV